MKPARALWPLLLAAGVGLSAWQWHEATEAPAGHGGHTHLHDDAGKPARLYSWDAKDAVQVTLATPAAAVTLTRGGQGWAAAPADRAAGFDAAAIVALFSQARSDRVLTPHDDQSYGLNPPQLRIDIRDAGGVGLARMAVGALAPDGLGRYVQLPEEPHIRIIPDYQTRAPMAAMLQGRTYTSIPLSDGYESATSTAGGTVHINAFRPAPRRIGDKHGKVHNETRARQARPGRHARTAVQGSHVAAATPTASRLGGRRGIRQSAVPGVDGVNPGVRCDGHPERRPRRLLCFRRLCRGKPRHVPGAQDRLPHPVVRRPVRGGHRCRPGAGQHHGIRADPPGPELRPHPQAADHLRRLPDSGRHPAPAATSQTRPTTWWWCR
ncbi:hypothetical protein G6F59_012823 [Rhizopus arrhizus]|nr:hypothetical protein G6F59_012823 [Rhizopus arrhizus]